MWLQQQGGETHVESAWIRPCAHGTLRVRRLSQRRYVWEVPRADAAPAQGVAGRLSDAMREADELARSYGLDDAPAESLLLRWSS
jgi:hypothetical protein